MRYRAITFRAPLPANSLLFAIRSHRSLTRFIAPLAHALDHFIEQKLHHNLDRLEALAHPNEDFALTDPRLPIFVVADGVTLEFNADGTYPLPSGAGRAARLFSIDALAEARRRYRHFSDRDLLAVFRAGNGAVGEFNRSRGRSQDRLNHWDYDLFAATAAFLVLKNKHAHWASICDSFIAQYDQNGTLKYRSPECWPNTPARRCFPKDWESRPEVDRKKELRRTYRNGISADNELTGYGVATGEKAAERYLNTGSFSFTAGDIVFLYTDGFERYFDLREFLDLFHRWPHNLKKQLQLFSETKARENGALYAHDRTLIALKFDKSEV